MINFIFCIHNHQPVGNFDFVVEDAYKNAYLPFLQALSKYPAIKLSLHTSGHLLDWLNENHKEYLDLLWQMIEKGQVEMMGAGYYEPVLAVIPESDRIGQIKLMSDKLNEYFGVRPKGIWLTERVWEPHLPEPLNKAGVEYVVVDDYHFVKAGFKKENLSGYYITEEQGNVLKVFPGSERLRYVMPFEPIEKFIEHLKDIENTLPQTANRLPLAVFADDGEKFGVWPGTHKWVYKEGWLERFFEALTHNLEWIKPVTFSEYLKSNGPSGRVYLPTTSYMEMGEWALPAEASLEYTNLIHDVKKWHDAERIKRFLQGGMWRNFMAKYSEANWMHKRMLMVSKESDKSENPAAINCLYKSQANDAYWHGVFGGLYLPHLRSSVYENLIKAENLVEDVKNQPAIAVREQDFDADTHNEILIKTPKFNVFLRPHSGGGIQELDFKPIAYNLTNVLTRRYEGYHHRVKTQGSEGGGEGTKSIHDTVVSKEQGLEKSLIYDNYERLSLVDRFIKHGATLSVDDLQTGRFEEGGDFVGAVYKHEFRNLPPNASTGGQNYEIILTRTGAAFGKPVRIEKKIYFTDDSMLRIDYQLANLDASPLRTLFCSEWNILLGFGLKARDMGSMEEFELEEDWLGLKFGMKLNPCANLYTYPIDTVSFSESGFERNFQGLCILPCWEINLEPGNACKIELSIDVTSIA